MPLLRIRRRSRSHYLRGWFRSPLSVKLFIRSLVLVTTRRYRGHAPYRLPTESYVLAMPVKRCTGSRAIAPTPLHLTPVTQRPSPSTPHPAPTAEPLRFVNNSLSSIRHKNACAGKFPAQAYRKYLSVAPLTSSYSCTGDATKVTPNKTSTGFS